MKKTYIIPALEVTPCVAEQMIAASITGIGGNSGLGKADPTEPVPTEADVKGSFYGETLFDE